MSNVITTCEVSDKDVIKAYYKFTKAYYETEDIIKNQNQTKNDKGDGLHI